MNRILAYGLAIASTLAQGGANTCDFISDKTVQQKFNTRSFVGFFRTNGQEVPTTVTFMMNGGRYTPQGQSSQSLTCVRYLTIEQASKLSEQGNAAGTDPGLYFDTSSCEAAIYADWMAGNTSGHVLWCASPYSRGAPVQGIYWRKSDWSKPEYTDIWEGHWQ